MDNNPVLSALADHCRLEQLYREDPESFGLQLEEALKAHPHAQILKFWHTRLHWPGQNRVARSALIRRSLYFVIVLGAVATTALKLPTYTSLDPLWFYPRFAPLTVLTALTLYISRSRVSPAAPERAAAAIGFTAALLYLWTLPGHEGSSSVTMALIHVPLVLWCLFGVAFCRGDWRRDSRWLAFLRFNGEIFAYTVLILLGGGVLTGAALALFALIGLDIGVWYQENVLIAGLACAPLVAAFIYDDLLERQSHIASLLARIFAPLFLVMVWAYLSAMLMTGRSPWTDREFLITYNGLLLLVLGITVFCIAGRDNDRPSLAYDLINSLLVLLTQAINLVALSAIVYRLAEYGASPNRVVVAGANILIFVHLCLIARAYVDVFRAKAANGALSRAVVQFIPIYAFWAGFVAAGLPVLFGFR